MTELILLSLTLSHAVAFFLGWWLRGEPKPNQGDPQSGGEGVHYFTDEDVEGDADGDA